MIMHAFMNALALLHPGQEPPVIDMYPGETVTVDAGGSAMFQCRIAEGIPSPTITWKRLCITQFTY